VWGTGEHIEGVGADGSNRHLIATDYGDSEGDPAWSLDGATLAFYARNSDTVEIHILRPKAKAHVVLTSDWRSPSRPRRSFAYILGPTWAPDGDHLAVSDSWNFVNAEIRIVSVSIKRWISLTAPNADRSDTEPAWSPDGGTIAFVRHGSSGKPVILVIGRNGDGLRRLTLGSSPSWSPDGRKLAFVDDDGVYQIAKDATGRVRIIRGRHFKSVRWSPDGRKLLYATDHNIWTTDIDGTHRKHVVHSAYIDGVAWQPG
jgi:Tol biopolymer transport system component